jgi:hypothetical protein
VSAEALIAAGRSWIGTPYHHMARVKGHGVDCGQILIAAHVEAGLADDFDPGYYTMDWHLHRSEERYLGFVETHLERVDAGAGDAPPRVRPTWSPSPGSVVVFRIGRTFSHGGLVSVWPNIIHANVHDGCVVESTIIGTVLEDRPMRTYIHGNLLP